ncbi:MAG: peptidylprolyl isomerase [Kordiimonadaceae bacterium]|jgi:peptidyl-prolyl cis-trans isomerase A (cyclophilin A)|nr:peptidylprolyl isomerase [Gammaproteobacteria bacterium]MBT5074677.1 peptidylprolyl isomerase [Kordiimonadaceae bacterium]MBT6036800.1 peptidylprolyl isomerase [Kordiimonadaceae bacterium]MBT6330166.1 peptidylprolyl isomerase [Kordiimonadaceae bacterium]MBT7583612.1 peptidylprolyl isomerase [Kordiimonadaceae bacterium]
MFRLKIFTLLFIVLSAISAQAETVKVKIETTMGDIHLDLYADKAPITVSNFLRYIDGGHFNGGGFYRVVRMNNQAQNNIKIEVIQGGMSGNSDIGLFEPITLERTNLTGIKHEDGTISMARGGADTASSEFFICVNEQPSLDFGGMRNADGQGFAAFGKVTMGMDVVRAIQNVKTDTPEGALEYTSGQSVLAPVIINSFSRE